MIVLAPGRLSITTCCLRLSLSLIATRRAMMSVPDPAGNGTIKRIGFTGYAVDCASAGQAQNVSRKPANTTLRWILDSSIIIGDRDRVSEVRRTIPEINRP